jgi:hypothetical protein
LTLSILLGRPHLQVERLVGAVFISC